MEESNAMGTGQDGLQLRNQETVSRKCLSKVQK